LSLVCFFTLVVKKFDLPTLDLKVYDESKTEVDEEVFELLNMYNNNNHLFYIALLRAPEVALQSPESSSHTHSHPGGGKLHQ